MEEDVVIVGGGIAGLATAVALKRVGVRAVVLERSEELRSTGAALTLFPNAWLALRSLGVAHKLTSVYPPFTRGYITDVANGAIQRVSIADRTGDGPRTVHRRALLEALAEDLPANTIRFSSKLATIDEAQNHEGQPIVLLHMEDGTVIKAKVVIGCDGVKSVVARWLGLSAPVSSGWSAVRGLSAYPEGHGLNPLIQQFVDVGKRGGFVPVSDTDIYWFFVCKTTSQDMAPNPELIQREVIENLASDFPSTFLDVVRHSDAASLTWAPLVLRKPWDVILTSACRGTVTVAGDAMHPMTPELGQGGCSALEDAVFLGRRIGESFIRNRRLAPAEVANALERYVAERRWRAAGLIIGSYVAGWVQQDGSGWLMKMFRDMLFYKLFYPRIMDVVRYDSGSLPEATSADQLEKQSTEI